MTGLRVSPDKRAIVHHVIVYMVGPNQVDQFMGFDAAEDGPGYTCYGGPTASDSGGLFANVDPVEVLAALNRLGLSPAGTGIRVEPGSMLVVQMHYNTLSSAPAPDRSTIEIATVGSVEREATTLPVVDLGWISNGLVGEAMDIPAGEAAVRHSTTVEFDSLFANRARQTLGLDADAPLVIHSANHHMHELGTSQRTELRHDDGSTSCVLDIPDWDFAWQGAYMLKQPMTLRRGDHLWMGCTWDNSPANQPIVDGAVREPTDVIWGEGTNDEMCLGGFYVTAQ